MNVPISNPILYHFWSHADIAKARSILQSVFKNGLLLTTNTSTLDSFRIDRGAGVVPMEVMQHPRVCFTDMPFDFLPIHGENYGKYGVGFKRETIVDWGGLPVWYLPNHWSSSSLKAVGPAIVNGLHAAKDAANHFEAIAKGLIEKNIPVSVQYTAGPTITGDQLVRELRTTAATIYNVLSFVKEMSPSNEENYKYLHEREWRIIAGFELPGQPSPFRVPTPAEKDLLCELKPAWRDRRKSIDPNISEPLLVICQVIDSFRFFYWPFKRP